MLSRDQKQEIARRLENWARWYYSAGGFGGKSPYPAYNLVNASSVRSASTSIPVLAGEGEDTDRLLRKMPPRMARALKTNYLANGNYITHARRHKVSPPTWYRMVERAERVFHRLCYPSRTKPQPVAKPLDSVRN